MRMYKIIVALLLAFGLSLPVFGQDFAITVTSGIPQELLATMQRVCFIPAHVSEVGIAFIKRHEGFRLQPYRDHGRIWTVGYGFTTWQGHRVTRTYPRRISRGAADTEFIRQLAKYEAIVQESVCTNLTQSAYDSLVSVAWNLGRINSTILMKLDADAARDVDVKDFLSTATVHGRPYRVLVARRLDEYAMFVQ